MIHWSSESSLLHPLQAALDREPWLKLHVPRCSNRQVQLSDPVNVDSNMQALSRVTDGVRVQPSREGGMKRERERECWPASVWNYLERGGTAVPVRPPPKSTFKQSEIVSSFQICGSTRVFLLCFSIKQLSFHSSCLSIPFPLTAVSPFSLQVYADENSNISTTFGTLFNK